MKTDATPHPHLIRNHHDDAAQVGTGTVASEPGGLGCLQKSFQVNMSRVECIPEH